jgi:hypothetical protein
MTRDQALLFVISVLRSPLLMRSPDRLEALKLVREFNITAEDLLNFGRK